jgi:hypothetical protein
MIRSLNPYGCVDSQRENTGCGSLCLYRCVCGSSCVLVGSSVGEQ